MLNPLPRSWLVALRALWVLLALNNIAYMFLTIAVAWNILQTPSVRITQGITELGLSISVYAGIQIGVLFITTLVFFIVALLIFLRLPNDRFALLASFVLLNFGSASAYPNFTEFLAFYNNPPLWYAIPYYLTNLGAWPFLVLFLFTYPDGHFVPFWTRWVTVAAALLMTAWALVPAIFNDTTTPLGLFGAFAAVALVCATFIAQVWRYRRYSTPLQKQQTKWFVSALGLCFIFTACTYTPTFFANSNLSPGQQLQRELTTALFTLGFIVLPIAIGIAILRYRLWDIDVFIRRTLTYAILSAFLALIYFASIVALQRLFTFFTGGSQNEIVTVVSTLGIAALFIPFRNRIQAVIDRRFYRNKYDAQQVLADFAITVRDETNLENLSAQLMHVVQETMQPASVSVWLQADNTTK